ncbi:MAG: T9SS type A sorting domain-containing protein [Chitinophagaceae bacterium]
MKRLFLFIFLVNGLNAMGQGFSGVQAFQADIILHQTSYTGGQASIGKMAFDGANNKYILGTFNGIMDVDPGPNVNTITSNDNGEAILIKEDAAGNFVWVKRFGDSRKNQGVSLTELETDATGNIYVAGSVTDSFDLDPGPNVFSFSKRGSFIMKLDSSGNFVWAKGFEVDTVPNSIIINDMKVVGNAIYVGTSFYGTVDLDPGPGISKVTSTSTVYRDMALIKLDTAGNFIWGNAILGTQKDNMNALAVDNAANVYITGGFEDTVDFDPGPGVFKLTETPWSLGFNFGYFSDIFIAKYDAAGNLAWAHSIGGHYDDEGKGIAVDRFGNVFVSGSYNSSSNYLNAIDFDPGPGVFTLNVAKTNFMLKLRNNGDFAWARNAGGGAITTDDTGNVYSGLQKLDSSGNIVLTGAWQAAYWGGDIPKIGWMGLDRKDTIYLTGSFSGYNTDFDPGKGVFLLSPLHYATSAGFILKLNQIPNPISTGIEGVNSQADLSVFPNPSSGIVTFSSPIAIRRISVTDMAGRLVYVNKPNKAKTVIDLGGTASGVYFYEVDCGSGKQRGKLVIY